MKPDVNNWSALFFTTPSPGQIVQIFERRALTTPEGGLLLSDAAGAKGLRALVAPEGTPDALRALAPTLATALGTPLTFLYQNGAEGRWGYALYEQGAETERADDTYTPPPPVSFLARLARRDTTPAPAVAWAGARDLPLHRLPAFAAPRVIPYELVARLDQKSLLVENTPRLYSFGIGK
jgi:hypothetical protein